MTPLLVAPLKVGRKNQRTQFNFRFHIATRAKVSSPKQCFEIEFTNLTAKKVAFMCLFPQKKRYSQFLTYFCDLNSFYFSS